MAQRLDKVFASASTWYKVIKERGWRRCRKRLHPSAPKEGLRADTPNAMWHIDVTVFRLVDGTKAYVQAIIDNFSRRVLAYRIGSSLEPAATATLLVKAMESLDRKSAESVSLMVDAGVENLNEAVNKLVEEGLLKRIFAQTDLHFSNSMIEAFWRAMKHNWCFLHRIESLAQLTRLVEFYVDAHNRTMPHSAFKGQTQDEMYFGTGAEVPQKLSEARAAARAKRMEENRKSACDACLKQAA